MEKRHFRGFVQKSVLFFLVLSLLLLSLYLLGNYQGFLDETQAMLLNLERTSTMLLAVCLLFSGVVQVLRKEAPVPGRIVLFILSLFGAAVSAGFSVFLSFILLWVGTAVR